MDLLNDNFKERTVFLLVDSKDRERSAFPTPAEFSITLDTAIAHVVGVEVVDAQVARTETNVDVHNNRLAIRAVGSSDWSIVYIKTDDYNTTTLPPVLEASVQGVSGIGFVSASVVGGKLTLSLENAVEINLSLTTARFVLGFGDLHADGSSGTEIVRSTVADGQISVLQRSGISLLPIQTASGMQLPALDFDCGVYGRLDVAFAGPAVVGWRICSKLDSNIVYAEYSAGTTYLRPGAYSIILIIDETRASVGQMVHLTTLSVSVHMSGHVITSTGLMDLAGTRYVTVRCPELEPYLYRGLPQSARRMGLAKIALMQAGYNSVAMATSNFVTNRFFPIAHLSRFSLRVEREDGELYNLKGVNFTVTLAVHVLQASPLRADDYGGISVIPRRRAFQPRDFERFEMQHP
jgi:hypothetical protein